MSERAPGRVVAGFQSLEGGMDSGNAPMLLQPNQCAYAFNTVFRGGYPHPRPGWKFVPLVFPEETVRARFEEEGRWQHGGHYEPDFGNSSLIAVIGGRFFQLKVGEDNSVQEITISQTDAGVTTYDLNSSKQDQGWSTQMEMFWLYNDGESRRFVFDGSRAWRQGPAGREMAYVKGRLWYALPSRKAFRVGDLVRSDSGTAQYQYRDSPLFETENTFLNEGGDFSVPGNSGGIRAMREVAVMDTSLGQGPLQVLTTNMIFSVNAPTDRDTWKDVIYPIQTKSLIGNGGQSQLSTTNVNSDLWFRSKKGWASLKLARRNFAGWSNTPQSGEIKRLIKGDTKELLRFCSAVEFDNRLIQTFAPVYSERGVWHRGVAVLDFENLSTLRKQNSENRADPAFDGAWTGLRILQLVKGDFGGIERCFMFVLNSEDKIELWEQTYDDHFDNGDKRIVWGFESARYPFTSGMTQLKRLDGGHFFIDSIEGRIDYEIRYRPDAYPFWVFWLSGQKCAGMNTCETDDGGCLTLEQFQQQYAPKVSFTEPSDECNPVTGRYYRDLFQCQIRYQFTGYAQITECLLQAMDQQMRPFGECAVSEAPCEPLTGCDLSPYNYSAE